VTGDESSFVQQAPTEGLWVRTDRGVVNLAHLKSVAIHKLSKDDPPSWMVFGHSAMPDARAIPLVKCATEAEAVEVLDALHGLVEALDLRRDVQEGAPA
jgi:hypothetical protein